MKTVSASDANRRFSTLLRDVGKGEIFEIISNGRAVAVLSPVSASQGAADAAKTRLLQRLRAQPRKVSQAWTRDELYDV